MENILDQLNDAQRAAVVWLDGPQLVIAGAGSGKTRVLTYKIAYLVSRGVAPWRILALTFTNKAANEMKQRIGTLVGEEHASRLKMGTFHSVFAKILRAEAKQYIKTIDPAHVIPVSRNYSMCYDEDNIISLNRYSHENLDSYRDPITGRSITREEVNKWWVRLLKACPSQWESFISKKYDKELQDERE